MKKSYGITGSYTTSKVPVPKGIYPEVSAKILWWWWCNFLSLFFFKITVASNISIFFFITGIKIAVKPL